MSIAHTIARAGRLRFCLGTGLALELRRPTDADVRALGGDVLRAVQIGAQAIQRARDEAEASASGMAPEEAARRAQGKLQLRLQHFYRRLEADAEFRAKYDARASGLVCAAVVSAAACPPEWAMGEIAPDAGAELEWEPLSLVPSRTEEDHDAGRVFVADALNFTQRQIVYSYLEGSEVVPPTIAAFRGRPEEPDPTLEDGGEVRPEAELDAGDLGG